MNVACVGGVTLDIRATASAELVLGSSNPGRTRRTPGGVAGNIAVGLARLGLEPSLFSVVGDDPAGVQVIEAYRRAGVAVEGINVVSGASTATYSAVLDQDGELVVAIADVRVLEEVAEAWVDATAQAVGNVGILVADTNLPEPILGELFRRRNPTCRLVVDPVSAAKSERIRALLGEIDVLLPDRAEAEALTGIAIAADDSARAAADALRARGASTVVLKLGEAGALVADATTTASYPSIHPDAIRDVTGAGDALAAGFLYGIAIEASDPITYGLAAASLTVESAESIAPGLSPASIEQRRVSAHR